MFVVSVTVPYVCPVISTWFEYPALLLIALIAACFSVYFSGQFRHLIWKMTLLSYLFVGVIVVCFVLCSAF
jgi:hypothetical protein